MTTGRTTRHDPLEFALAATALLAGLALAWHGGLTPDLFPDSQAYLTFSPSVPAGYPLFVAAIGTAWLPAAQIALYAGCAAILSVTVQRLFGRWWISAGLLAALFVNPEADAFLRAVLSEGLFLSLDLLFLAALLAFAARGSRRAALTAAVLAGLTVTVRPIAYPLIATVLAAVLLRPGGWSRAGVVLAATCLIAWSGTIAVERGWSRWYHGDRLTSLTGPHLYAKGALLATGPIDTAGFTPLERVLADRAERGYAPIRTMLAHQRETVAYPALLAYYEVCIQHGCTRDLRDAAPDVTAAAFNRAMARVGLARVRRDPLGFVGIAVQEYCSSWSLNSRTHPARADAFDAAIATARPLPLEAKIGAQLFEKTRASRIAYIVRPLFIALGILIPLTMVAAAALLALRPRATPLALPLLAVSAGVVAVSLFTAFAGIGEGRYTMGLWPNIATTMLLTVALADALLGHRRFSSRRTIDV